MKRYSKVNIRPMPLPRRKKLKTTPGPRKVLEGGPFNGKAIPLNLPGTLPIVVHGEMGQYVVNPKGANVWRPA